MCYLNRLGIVFLFKSDKLVLKMRLYFSNRKGWNKMELRTNIIGYHVNDKDRCQKFIDEEEIIIFSEDIYWLGYGMYFWDNQANAKYWIQEKKRKDKTVEYIAQVKANIFIIR